MKLLQNVSGYVMAISAVFLVLIPIYCGAVTGFTLILHGTLFYTKAQYLGIVVLWITLLIVFSCAQHICYAIERDLQDD